MLKLKLAMRTRDTHHSSENQKKTEAVLRIYHDSLDPDEITALLAVTPTKSHAKGYISTELGMQLPPARTGAWLLSSSSLTDSDSLDDHISRLMGVVSTQKEAFRQLLANGFTIDVRCAMTTTSLGIVQKLSADCLQRISEAGLGLEFCFMCFCTDASEHRELS